MISLIIKYVVKSCKDQVSASIASFLLDTIAGWLNFSQDNVRNAIMSFLTDPQRFPDVLFIFSAIAFFPVFLEIYRSFSRKSAIIYGSILIFENQDMLTTQELTSKWWEASGKSEFFDYNHNYERIRIDYIRGKLNLEEPGKVLNLGQPFPEMLIRKTEFIRWMIADKHLLVPGKWGKRVT